MGRSNDFVHSTRPTVNRDTVFVSHANPEDNTFALWLALRLGELGFKVWCDLTNLIGGEAFWDNAEDAVRRAHGVDATSFVAPHYGQVFRY